MRMVNIKPVRSTVVLLSPQKLANVTITAKREVISSRFSPKTCIILIYILGVGVD